MNKEITTIQCTEITLSYTVPKSQSDFLESLQNQINKECRYETLTIYKSNNFIKTDKQLVAFEKEPCDYFYFRFRFNSRQKLIQSNIYLNIVAPKYYIFKNESIYLCPVLFERGSDHNSVDRLTKLVSEEKIEILGEYSRNALRLRDSISTNTKDNYLEQHFFKLCKCRNLQEFYQYIEDNNLYFFVDVIITKMKALADLQKRVNKPLIMNDLLINPLSSKGQDINSKKFWKPEENFIKDINSLNDESNIISLEDNPIYRGLSINNDIIYKILDEDDYSDTEACKYIFNSKNLDQDSRIKDIALQLYVNKTVNNQKLNKNTSALNFVCYHLKIVNTIPYRINNPNKQLEKPFLFMSEDLKETYKVYIKKNKK